MAMPRKFWVLVGWVIALTTLATAASVVQHTYSDLQRIGECEVPNLADRHACADQRLIEGAAKMAAAVARVPALGLAAIATAIGFASYRRRPRPMQGQTASDGFQHGAAAPGATSPATPGTPGASRSGKGRTPTAPRGGTAADAPSGPAPTAPGMQDPGPTGSGGPSPEAAAPEDAPGKGASKARARRRSKAPSTTLDEAATA